MGLPPAGRGAAPPAGGWKSDAYGFAPMGFGVNGGDPIAAGVVPCAPVNQNVARRSPSKKARRAGATHLVSSASVTEQRMTSQLERHHDLKFATLTRDGTR